MAAGDLRAFTLPPAPGGTPRGQALRSGMVAIVHGDGISNGELARGIGSAPREIGQPCARAIRFRSSSRVTLCSAPERLLTKRWLLDHEQHVAGKQPL